MKTPVQIIFTVLVTALMSSSAFAIISFSDDFEGYPIYEGGDATDLGGGWTYFVNVFGNFAACDSYLYGYGPGPTPNGPNISNIVAGSNGNALNVFSNYGDDQHANGNCLETNVFQERIVTGADLGSYTFTFETQVPGDLGTDVQTFGFIKLIDANNFSTLIFENVSTVTAGAKSISVDLDATAEGQILQWGFANVASNYLPSGRWYDNVEFAAAPVVPPVGPNTEGIPIPLWALLGMAGLLAFFGASKLRAGRKA